MRAVLQGPQDGIRGRGEKQSRGRGLPSAPGVTASWTRSCLCAGTWLHPAAAGAGWLVVNVLPFLQSSSSLPRPDAFSVFLLVCDVYEFFEDRDKAKLMNGSDVFLALELSPASLGYCPSSASNSLKSGGGRLTNLPANTSQAEGQTPTCVLRGSPCGWGVPNKSFPREVFSVIFRVNRLF